MIIKINVANKRPTVEGAPVIVCGNSGYSIKFTFDGEWDALPARTARFSYTKEGEKKHQEVPFVGTTVAVPKLSGIRWVEVGVYAGDLQTTTPARIPCDLSILCGSSTHEEPPEDVYQQLLALMTAVPPTVDVNEVEGGHRVTITSAEGVQSFDVLDGKDSNVDPTLTQEGQAADAAAVGTMAQQMGEAFNALSGAVEELSQETDAALSDLSGKVEASGNAINALAQGVAANQEEIAALKEADTGCACFEDVMAETKLLFDVTVETGQQTYIESPRSKIPAVILGKAYILTIDGHKFEAVAEADTYNGIDIVRIGDLSAAMPFMFGVSTDGSLGACMVYDSYIEGEYASGSVENNNVKRYLTLSLRETKLTGLPAVTTADNGKLLQVVDGAWTVVSMADSAVGAYVDAYIAEALGGDY